MVFLGEVNENKLNTLKDIISSLNVNFESIKINKFTKLKDMLIGEIEKEINLITLQKELVIKLKDNGFKIEDRSFYPHITLIRQVMGLKPLKIIDSKLEIESMVNKITLFESTRINGKLTYIPKN